MTAAPFCFFAILRGLDFFAAPFADFFDALAIDHPNRGAANLRAKLESTSIKV
jgi:hypothetical protein